MDARGYLSFFVFFLFLEFKDEFRRDFLHTIPPNYNAPFYLFRFEKNCVVFLQLTAFIYHLNGVAATTATRKNGVADTRERGYRCTERGYRCTERGCRCSEQVVSS